MAALKARSTEQTNSRRVRVEIGSFFRSKRLEAGLSERQLASYLDGVSVELLRKYESGERAIPVCQVYSLANCLNIPPDEVLERLHLFSRQVR